MADVGEEVPPQDTPGSDCPDMPADAPLPTNSMITVRLSDIPFDPDLDGPLDHRASRGGSVLRSTPSSTRSSRSSSQTSDSSTSLNSVNWEGLEKTEEQEPKDEATDEVSRVGTNSREREMLTEGSPLLCSWLVSKKKMPHLRPIPRLE